VMSAGGYPARVQRAIAAQVGNDVSEERVSDVRLTSAGRFIVVRLVSEYRVNDPLWKNGRSRVDRAVSMMVTSPWTSDGSASSASCALPLSIVTVPVVKAGNATDVTLSSDSLNSPEERLGRLTVVTFVLKRNTRQLVSFGAEMPSTPEPERSS